MAPGSNYLYGLGPNFTSQASPTTPTSNVAIPQFQSPSNQNGQFIMTEGLKTSLLESLITENNQLVQQYNELLSQWKVDRGLVKVLEAEKVEYEKYLQSIQRSMVDKPVVMLFLDGDGMVFHNDFIRDGEKGGHRAALQLNAAVEKYIENECADIPLAARVICRIFASVRGLGDLLVRSGALENNKQFEDFVRGFTRAKSLFDFIDVGESGTTHKIIESIKLYSGDYHCRRLMLGCSNNNAYREVLLEHSKEVGALGKIVLLESIPFTKDFSDLPYATQKFPGIFREKKLSFWTVADEFIPASKAKIDPPLPKTFSIISGLPTRFPPPDRSPDVGKLDSPSLSHASLPSLTRTPSVSSIASDKPKSVAPANTWAAKAAAPAPPGSSPIVYKAVRREEIIARNRAGQRIDPPCKDYNKAEVDRIKKMKMCNVHFLRKECPFDKQCTHLHDYRPTPGEVATLRLVARLAPCLHGSGCDDVKCIYGHRCPAPPHPTRHVKGTKSCIFLDTCKFPEELHDLDLHVVKTLTIR